MWILYDCQVFDRELTMTMSERNQLLVEFQDHMRTNLRVLVKGMEKHTGIILTSDEIKGALQHVILNYGK